MLCTPVCQARLWQWLLCGSLLASSMAVVCARNIRIARHLQAAADVQPTLQRTGGAGSTMVLPFAPQEEEASSTPASSKAALGVSVKHAHPIRQQHSKPPRQTGMVSSHSPSGMVRPVASLPPVVSTARISEVSPLCRHDVRMSRRAGDHDTAAHCVMHVNPPDMGGAGKAAAVVLCSCLTRRCMPCRLDASVSLSGMW